MPQCWKLFGPYRSSRKRINKYLGVSGSLGGTTILIIYRDTYLLKNIYVLPYFLLLITLISIECYANSRLDIIFYLLIQTLEICLSVTIFTNKIRKNDTICVM